MSSSMAGNGASEGSRQAPPALAAGDDEYLDAGWEPWLPSDDSLQLALVRNHVAQVRTLAQAPSYELLDTDGVAAACSGLAEPLLNLAVLTAPLDREEGMAGLEALEHFAAARPGLPFAVYCSYGAPDLRARGHAPVGHPPVMLLAEPARAPVPSGPEVVEVADGASLETWADVVRRAYPFEGLVDGDLEVLHRCIHPSLFGSGWHFFLAVDTDGTPLGTSAVFVAEGIQVLEFVAVLPEARGRGVGAAVTAAAHRVVPELPALLVASDLGQSVYQRLRYLRLERTTLWLVTG